MLCRSPNGEVVKAATRYNTRAWPNVKTQETNVKSSLLYTYNALNCLVLAFSKKRKKKLKFVHKL